MDDDLPTVVSSGTMRLGAMELTVHQLSDGRRVFDAADMDALIALLNCDSGSGPQGGDNSLAPGEAPQSGGASRIAHPFKDTQP